MELLLTALSLPFMQRALIAGALIAPLLGLFGIIVSMRKMAFFGDGIAHASLAGIALAIMVGAAPLPVAVLWACAVGAIIFYLERKTAISADVAIGILFTASMAFGILLMSQTPGYQPELITYLFGNILAVRHADVLSLIVLVPILFGWLAFSFQKLTLLSINVDLAHVRGIRTDVLLFLFYILLAIALVLSTKIMGIILVSALLVIPSATARNIATSYRALIAFTLIFSLMIAIVGLLLSYTTNTPSGAMIVLTGSACFLLTTVWKIGFAHN